MEELIIMPDFAVTEMRKAGKKKLIYEDDIARIEWEFVPISQARDYWIFQWLAPLLVFLGCLAGAIYFVTAIVKIVYLWQLHLKNKRMEN